jgi:hypothetical protein
MKTELEEAEIKGDAKKWLQQLDYNATTINGRINY